MPRASDQRLPTADSDLEMCVLGLIAESGPCTAYSVGKALESSLSSFWSSSAGSVYPLMRRLLDRRWVKASRHAWGRRGKVRFEIAPAGRRRLERWLTPPLPDWVATYTLDPIRTRAFFLDLLPYGGRRTFVRHALAVTRQALRRLRRSCREARRSERRFEYLGRLGAVRQLEARLRWLVEMQTASPPPPAPRRRLRPPGGFR